MSRATFDTFHNVVNGKLVSTEHTRHGINPATLKNLAPVPISTQQDVQAAVDAAKRAGPAWASTPLQQRQQQVQRFADALESRRDELAKMLTVEQGKPLARAKTEISNAIGVLRGIAKLELQEVVLEDSETTRVVTRHVPIGMMKEEQEREAKRGNVSRVLNVSQVSASESFPGTLAEIAQDFFPAGVVQALSGDDNLGPWLTEHPDVGKVSFTGSTATGMSVMKSCAATLKRVTLELGGNDPAIICPNVDVDAVAKKIADLALYNSGQTCIAIKRIFVHSSIYDSFLKSVTEAVQKMTVGNGLETGSILGPVQNKLQYEKLINLFESIENDDTLVINATRQETFPNKTGYFVNPVIVANPPDTSRIVMEEPFGPFFPVLKWDREDEVIQRANNSQNGLGASVWSDDPAEADRIANQLQAGNVWINTHAHLRPDAAFGGHKHSGIGSELGVEGLKAYCNVQTVHHQKSRSRL
ncbi:hypothetical protein E4U55_007873 [Claviceps digitariae]|nr:hypothetical protein E4U55_007873 [Claviceps digitariae]